jgi:DNA modification methylase
VADNQLYYGDNLDVLRKHIADESVDLVYLDPPFNSNRNYNVIFGKHATANGAAAQIQAFGDTWSWTHVTDQQYEEAVGGGVPGDVADALIALRRLLTENDAMAYLVNMAPRLVELRRVLRSTGTLYLHCDPTMSHYLKVLLDTIFGPENFKSEIVWKRSSAHSGAKKWGPVHDTILMFGKSSRHTWNPQYVSESQESIAKWYVHEDERGVYKRGDLTGAGTRSGASGEPWRGFNPTEKGRHWAVPRDVLAKITDEPGSLTTPQEALDLLFEDGRIIWPKKPGGQPMLKRYFHEAKGVPAADVITDIPPLSLTTSERLGYPTQKPLALLERIVRASSSEGQVVLDPFCGCGTTVDAAERLKRKWIGIDITYIAIDLIAKRLRHTYGPGITASYDVLGIPRDLGGAQALFERSPFDFERWAVSLINAQPNEKQVGDKGIDGVARFIIDTKGAVGRVLASVKGGKTVTPQFVRDLIGTIETQKAQMGVLITMAEPSRGVLDAVAHGGNYTWTVNGETFPRVQAITVKRLLKGERPRTPALLMPYIPAHRLVSTADQGTFF